MGHRTSVTSQQTTRTLLLLDKQSFLRSKLHDSWMRASLCRTWLRTQARDTHFKLWRNISKLRNPNAYL